MVNLIKQVCRVKIITRSQLDAVVILFLTEFGVVRPCEETGLQPQFEVCNPRIKRDLCIIAVLVIARSGATWQSLIFTMSSRLLHVRSQ